MEEEEESWRRRPYRQGVRFEGPWNSVMMPIKHVRPLAHFSFLLPQSFPFSPLNRFLFQRSLFLAIREISETWCNTLRDLSIRDTVQNN